jgi:hypothetical protein
MKRKPIIFLLCMSCALWLGTGCDNGVGTASLSLRLTSQYGRADARTIVPTGESLTIHSYSIEGSGPNGKTFSITTQSAQVLIEGLVYGTWAIQATGLNEQGTELATGSTSHQLTTTSTQAELELDTLVGTGMLDISFSWEEPSFPSIVLDVYITPQGGQESKVSSGLSIDTTTATARYEAVKASGSYGLRYELFSNAVKIAGGTEALRIIDGATTSGTIVLTVDKESSTSQGLRIVDDTAVPIEGTITGVDATILPNTPVTATFNHLRGGGTTDITIEWYLDGGLVGTGSSTTFSTFTGPHRLDAFATSARLGSFGSATIPFRASVNATEGVPVVLDMVAHGQTDSAENTFNLSNASDCIFLRDGRLLVASANTLQLMEIVQDELRVVNTFCEGGALTDPATTDQYTYGVTDLAVDLFDDIVATVSPSTKTLMLYEYDSEQADLVKIDYRQSDNTTDEWWDSMGNPVIDPVNDFLYFLDGQGGWLFYYGYDSTGLECLGISELQSAVQGLTLSDPGRLSISATGERLGIVCPANGSFHLFYNHLTNIPPNPLSSVQTSIACASGATAGLQGIRLFASDLYTFESSGISHYHRSTGTNLWTPTTTITDGLGPVVDMVVDTSRTKGWVLSTTAITGIALLEFINGVPSCGDAVATGQFIGKRLALAPEEDFLAAVGTDSNLMLLRVSDD